MSYIGAQCRVRLEIPRAAFLRSDAPPEDLCSRAEAKLASEKEKGNLIGYEIYRDRLQHIWQLARNHDIKVEESLSFTLANGCPKMDGLEIDLLAGDEDLIGYLLFKVDQATYARWRFMLVNYFVAHRLKALKCKWAADSAYVRLAWLQAAPGGFQCSFPIHRLPVIDPGTGYSLYTDEKVGLIGVSVQDVSPFATDTAMRPLLGEVKREAERLDTVTGFHHELMIEDIVRRLRSAFRGPERFGIGCPFTILGAYRTNAPRKTRRPVAAKTKVVQPAARPAHAAASTPAMVSTSDPGQADAAPAADAAAVHAAAPAATDPAIEKIAAYVQVSITPDKLSASITSFDDTIYKENINLTPPLWKAFLASQGITFGVEQKYVNPITRRYKEKEDLTNMKVAQGVATIHPESPFLYPTFKHKLEGTYEPRGGPEGQPGHDQPKRLFSQKQDIVAEIRFGNIPMEGIEVTGQKIAPRPPPELAIGLGTGVRQDGHYIYADIPGVPKIEGTDISMEKVIIVDSDLDSSKGPIEFEGNLVISGNVEERTILDVTGDIKVGGCIYGGRVNVGGDLFVEEGIRQAPGSIVRVKGTLTTKFIETSEVECAGNITVAEHIINSSVMSGGELVIREGTVSGGEVVCTGDMQGQHFGREKGSNTIIRIGCDLPYERKLKILRRRKARLEELEDQYKELVESFSAKARQTKNEKEILQRTKKNLKRLPLMIRKVGRRIGTAEAALNYENASKLIARGVLSSNCSIRIGGIEIPITDSHEAVQVRAQERNGTHFSSLDGSSAASSEAPAEAPVDKTEENAKESS